MSWKALRDMVLTWGLGMTLVGASSFSGIRTAKGMSKCFHEVFTTSLVWGTGVCLIHLELTVGLKKILKCLILIYLLGTIFRSAPLLPPYLLQNAIQFRYFQSSLCPTV